jgi:hypothetical protein
MRRKKQCRLCYKRERVDVHKKRVKKRQVLCFSLTMYVLHVRVPLPLVTYIITRFGHYEAVIIQQFSTLYSPPIGQCLQLGEGHIVVDNEGF